MDREDSIRQRAHRIWEDEGRPEGRDREHWDQAAREVDGEPGEASTANNETRTASQSPEPTSADPPSTVPDRAGSDRSSIRGAAKQSAGRAARR
jgi:hypothetical protein